MHILLFILLFLVIIAVLGLSIVGAVLRAVFGIGRRSSSRPNQTKYDRSGQKQQQAGSGYQSSDDNEHISAEAKASRKKIFTKDEGEYVDFEEIK